MTSKLACPRCKEEFSKEIYESTTDSPFIMPCPFCRFEFSLSDYKKQYKRLALKRNGLGDSEMHRLISDTPSSRTSKNSITIKLGEWIRWKFGHKKTEEILILRSGVHQVFSKCANLCDLYPAIPYNLNNEGQLKKFWTNREHEFLLGNILGWMRDVEYIANKFFNKGTLTRGEIRKIIDEELPHASWEGRIKTYNIMQPEFRGFLLAVMIINLTSYKIPTLMRQIQQWLKEDGWDEYGCTKKADD